MIQKPLKASKFAEVSACSWTVATRCESRLLHLRVQCSAALSQRVRTPEDAIHTIRIDTMHLQCSK